MSRFDFHNVHRRTGVLVIVTFVVLLVPLLAAARVQRWFEPVYRLEVDLGEGVPGLEVGSDVKMLGTTIGRVESLTLDENENRELVAIARMALRGSMVRFIREDSEVIKQGGGILGAAHLEIKRGPAGQPLFGEGVREASLTRGISPAEDMIAEARKIAEELLEQVKQIVARAEEEGALGLLVGFDQREKFLARFDTQGALGLALGPDGYDRAISLLSALDEDGLIRVLTGDPEAALALADAMKRLSEVVASIEQNGPLGWLLGKSPAGASLEEMLAAFSDQVRRLEQRGPLDFFLSDPNADPDRGARLAEELERIVVNLRRATDTLPPLAESLGEEAAALPGVVAESQETLRQIEILVRAIQQHWLIRSYVDPRPADGRIPLENIGLQESRR